MLLWSLEFDPLPFESPPSWFASPLVSSVVGATLTRAYCVPPYPPAQRLSWPDELPIGSGDFPSR